MIVAAIVVTSLVIIPSSFQKAEAILGVDV
jgi:hypothetical protein